MREEGEGRDFIRVWVEHQGDGQLTDFQFELVSLFFFFYKTKKKLFNKAAVLYTFSTLSFFCVFILLL